VCCYICSTRNFIKNTAHKLLEIINTRIVPANGILYSKNYTEIDSLNYVTYEFVTNATLYVELEAFKGNWVL
jgi:hypothetical protein